jgi:small subunit ribosomal protein S3e
MLKWSKFSFKSLVCICLSGEKGRRIRELTSVVQKRFKFPENGVELYAEKVNNRGLCAIAQAESLRYKLLGGLAVRRYIALLQLYWLICYW